MVCNYRALTASLCRTNAFLAQFIPLYVEDVCVFLVFVCF